MQLDEDIDTWKESLQKTELRCNLLIFNTNMFSLSLLIATLEMLDMKDSTNSISQLWDLGNDWL